MRKEKRNRALCFILAFFILVGLVGCVDISTDIEPTNAPTQAITEAPEPTAEPTAEPTEAPEPIKATDIPA